LYQEVGKVKKKIEGFFREAGVWIHGIFFGTFVDKSVGIIRKEAFDMNDNMMLLLYGDLLGIPNPISYYSLELLPYLAEELEPWQRRMLHRKYIVEEKAAQYDFC
jgi:hypothetical protein